ncbi:MAG: F0F1 ATP synthase subunit B [Tissierellia bacterium]|nr:F0F1 ATP synthase subunit B [Tissierellia bacterium]
MDITVHVVPDFANVIAQLLATLILFLVVRHFIYQPMTDFLNKRKAQVMEDLTQAKNTNIEAQELKDQYEKKLQDAKEEAQSILEGSRSRGREIQAQMAEEGKREAGKMIDRARSQIDQERAQAQDEIYASVSEMALLVAGKILNKNLDAKGQEAVIDQAIKDLENNHVQ